LRRLIVRRSTEAALAADAEHLVAIGFSANTKVVEQPSSVRSRLSRMRTAVLGICVTIGHYRVKVGPTAVAETIADIGRSSNYW